MEFHIGQEVVCILSHSSGIYKEGQVFTIQGLKQGFCKCHSVILDIGLNTGKQATKCTPCGILDTSSPNYFGGIAFKPLDELCNIDELTEVLKTEAFN